jgi:hypothetical protein
MYKTMNNTLVLTTFIKQLDEWLEDITLCYKPNDARFIKCKLYFETIKQGNPKLLITLWKSKITIPYKDQILQGNIVFFLDKDYKEDISTNYNDTIDNAIQDLRKVIRTMNQENIQMSLKYIQNLCKLSELYN